MLIPRPTNPLLVIGVGMRSRGYKPDGSGWDGTRDVEDPMPANGVVGIDFFAGGGVLFVDEDEFADCDGVVESL